LINDIGDPDLVYARDSQPVKPAAPTFTAYDVGSLRLKIVTTMMVVDQLQKDNDDLARRVLALEESAHGH